MFYAIAICCSFGRWFLYNKVFISRYSKDTTATPCGKPLWLRHRCHGIGVSEAASEDTSRRREGRARACSPSPKILARRNPAPVKLINLLA